MFKKDYQRTPQEKAQRAKMSILARLLGCGYLIYIMVQLLKTPKEQTPGSWTVVVAIVMLVAAGVVIAITIWDLIRSIKMGIFNPAIYEDQSSRSFPNPDDDTGAEPANNELDEHAESSPDDSVETGEEQDDDEKTDA
jgi:cytoskeletal protein RodZ